MAHGDQVYVNTATQDCMAPNNTATESLTLRHHNNKRKGRRKWLKQQTKQAIRDLLIPKYFLENATEEPRGPSSVYLDHIDSYGGTGQSMTTGQLWSIHGASTNNGLQRVSRQLDPTFCGAEFTAREEKQLFFPLLDCKEFPENQRTIIILFLL